MVENFYGLKCQIGKETLEFKFISMSKHLLTISHWWKCITNTWSSSTQLLYVRKIYTALHSEKMKKVIWKSKEISHLTNQMILT